MLGAYVLYDLIFPNIEEDILLKYINIYYFINYSINGIKKS